MALALGRREPPRLWHESAAVSWLPWSTASGAETELQQHQMDDRPDIMMCAGIGRPDRRVPLAWLLPSAPASTPVYGEPSDLRAAHRHDCLNAPGHWDIFIGHSRRTRMLNTRGVSSFND